MGRRRAVPSAALVCPLLLMVALMTMTILPGTATPFWSSSSGGGGGENDTESGAWMRSTGSGSSFSGPAVAAASSSAGHIAFVPERVDLGRVHACAMRSFFVSIENRGPRRVKLQRADFSRENLALATDVAGIHLDPGGRFLVELRYLPSEPAPRSGALFRVLTSSGRFSLPILSRVEPNPAGARALRATVPIGASVHHTITLTNPKTSTLRVTDVFALEDRLHLSFPGGESAITPRRQDEERSGGRQQSKQQLADRQGPWEIAPGTSKPLVRLSFHAEEPGEFLSYVHIQADSQPFLIVPVRVTVLRERTVTIEPSTMDAGVLMSRRQPHREVVTVYNTLASPVRIDRIRASPTPSKMSKGSLSAAVHVRMVGEPFVLAPRSGADVTLQLEFPNSAGSDANSDLESRSVGPTSGFAGDFDITVTLETSTASDASLESDSPPKPMTTTPFGVRIVGKILDGAIAYRQRDTMFALTLPLTHVFSPESSQDRINEMEMNVSVPLPMSTMPLGDAAAMTTLMEAGTHLTRVFRLRNQFNVPLELQRVYIEDDIDNKDDGFDPIGSFTEKEVTLSHFNRSTVAAPESFWPALELNLSPSLGREDLALRGDGQLLASRTYRLIVETNATIHEIPLHFYHGIVQVRSIHGLSRHSLSGFVNESTPSGSDNWMKTERSNRKPIENIDKMEKKKKKKKISQQQPSDVERKVENDHLYRTCASVYGSVGYPMMTDMLAKPRVPTKRQRSFDGEPPTPFGARVCRSLQFDLGKIAIRGEARAFETLTITNWNPIPIEMALSRVAQPSLFTFDIHAEMKTFDASDNDDSNIPGTLSSLHAQWHANASFIRSNERRLAMLSSCHHDQPSDDPDGGGNCDDTSSSPFVVPPGHSVELHLDIQLADTVGMFTAHMLTLRTPFEVIHIHAFLDILDGVVEPVETEIELSPTFAGQTQLVELHYRNTFKHTVRVTNVTVPNGMEITTVSATIPAKSESALQLYFVPSDVQLCAGRRMVVDCLLPPLDVPVAIDESEGGDGRNHALSDFGMYVSPSDLIALARRNDFWAQIASHNHGAAVLSGAITGLVEIETDLFRKVPPVKFSIPLARPRIVISGVSELGDGEPITEDEDGSDLADASSSTPVKVHFPVTQLFHISHAFVNVSNPANLTIHAELVCAYAQRRFFYMCDKQTGDGVDNDRECLDKWRELVADAASNPTCHADEEGAQDGDCSSGLIVDAPLFSFRHRIVEIPAGGHSLLGPIYYLPGYTHQVTAELYVRNQLSHIEPIHLVASSGKPTLSLSALTPFESGVSVNNGSTLAWREKLQWDAEHRGSSILEFTIDEAIAGSEKESSERGSSEFTRRANLQLANTGEFDLQISKVWLVDRDAGANDDDEAGSEVPFEIVAFPGQITLRRSKDTEDGTPVVGENGAFAVLEPGDWMQFGIVFRPTCLAARAHVNVLLETNDDRRIISLTGTISTAAAFECLRQRRVLKEQLFLRALWALSILAGSICVLCVLLNAVRAATVSSMRPLSENPACAVCEVDKKERGALTSVTGSRAVSSNVDGDGSDDEESGVSEACRFMSEMEQVPFKPALPISLSSVTSVLERRQRGAFSAEAILKSLGGDGEQMDSSAKTLEQSKGTETPTPRLERMAVPDPAKRGPSSARAVLELKPSVVETTTLEVLSNEVISEVNSDERVKEDIMNKPEHPTTQSMLLQDTSKLTASSYSTEAIKSIESAAGGHAGGIIGASDDRCLAPDQQANCEEISKTDGEANLDSSNAEVNSSFGFASLKSPSRTDVSDDTVSKRDVDLLWSVWDSKTWWQPSAENSSLESNRPLGGGKERDGGGLIPLRSLDSPPALDFDISRVAGSELCDFDSSSARLHLGGDLVGAMLSDAAPPARPRAASATKAPPGFSPADATPLVTRAAFAKLRPGVFSSPSGDSSASVHDSSIGLERGVMPPSDDLRAGGGALSLLSLLEPSSEPLMALLDSPGNQRGTLGGRGHTRTASLGEIGSKRPASSRGMWVDGSDSGDGGSGNGTSAGDGRRRLA